jgi:acylphosphatase
MSNRNPISDFINSGESSQTKLRVQGRVQSVFILDEAQIATTLATQMKLQGVYRIRGDSRC